MRRANGSGGVSKLSGKRRKPYVARITISWDIVDGKVIQNRKVIGTFATKKEARAAIENYFRSPYDITNKTTMKELYEQWGKESARGDNKNYKWAWDYCSSIYDLKVVDFNIMYFKSVIKNGTHITTKKPAKKAAQHYIKLLLGFLLDYAVESNIIANNCIRQYKSFSEIQNKEETTHHKAFSDEELKKLWGHADDDDIVKMILIACYSGWRPSELVGLTVNNVTDDIMIGGMKTDNGKNRHVPIHPCIKPFVDYFKAKTTCEYLFETKGKQMAYDYFFRKARTIMEKINVSKHSPHDCRATFVTLCKNSQMDEYALKRIVGHSISDLTESVYTTRSDEWLMSEMLKIKVDDNQDNDTNR